MPHSSFSLVDQTVGSKKLQPRTRSDKRSLVFQMLYSLDRSDYLVHEEQFLADFIVHMDVDLGEDGFVKELFFGVVGARNLLSDHVTPFLKNWDQSRMSCSVRLLLAMGCWELLFQKETPSSVVIDEYIELTKGYAEADAYRLVNGVLDQVSKKQNNLVACESVKEAVSQAL